MICLINSSQIPVARYHYDPYGNLLTKSGPLADANVYRFSSKEWHEKSGLVYYLYRYYEPNLQRWLNRDPIGERGGINLYQFVYNSPLSELDIYGFATKSKNEDKTQTITVEKCEVVVLRGHGKSSPHIFKGPPGGCWAGGFIGCYAGCTNEKLGENKIPGSPNWDDEIMDTDEEYTKAWQDIQKGADEAAQKICDNGKCNCKSVTIIYMYAPNYTVDDIARPCLPKDKKVDCGK
jgi:RHS repeat-associated protein